MNCERWIMVSDGTPQMLYLGKTFLRDEDIEKDRAIRLNECRCLRTLLIPGPQGVGQQNLLTSYAIARAGVVLRVRPVSWWWPDEDKDAAEIVSKMIEHAEAEELKHRVEKAGIVLTGDMPRERR